MAGRRVARLNEQLKREITILLQTEVRDPRIGFATVTEVSVTSDLAFARVYVTVMGEDAERDETMAGLRAAAPFLRSELGRRLRIRRAPELRFELDRTFEQAMRIERLLHEIRPAGEAGPEAGPGSEDGEPQPSADGHQDEDA